MVKNWPEKKKGSKGLWINFIISSIPNFPRRLISWSGLTTSFSVSSHGWSVVNWLILVCSSTDANRQLAAAVPSGKRRFISPFPLASRIAFADILIQFAQNYINQSKSATKSNSSSQNIKKSHWFFTARVWTFWTPWPFLHNFYCHCHGWWQDRNRREIAIQGHSH